MSVKTLHEVNIPWEFNNRAEFVAQSFAGFKWILGYRFDGLSSLSGSHVIAKRPEII